MAYVFQTFRKNGKPHPKWRFQFQDKDGKRRTATGLTSRRETEKLAVRVEAEHDAIRKGLVAAPPVDREYRKREFLVVCQEYIAWGNVQGGHGGRPWGREHARKREAQLVWWGEHLALEVMEDLDTSLARVESQLRLLQSAGRSGKTIANYAESLRGFCSWCVTRGYLNKNPVEHLGRIDITPVSSRRALNRDEISRVLAVAPHYRRLLYETAFTSGLRANELRSLSVNDLDVEGCGLILHAEWTKNRKAGFQPLPECLIGELAAFAASGGPQYYYQRYYKRPSTKFTIPAEPLLFVPSNPAKTLDGDLVRAGVAKHTAHGKVDFHACRVAYVTLVLESGAQVREAQSLARHGSPKLTMNVYGRVRDERLALLSEAVGEAVRVNSNTTCAEKNNTTCVSDDESDNCDDGQGGSNPPRPFLEVAA